MEKITIIGLGHIGGSFAKDIREHGLAHTLIGVEANPEHAQLALDLGLVDRVEEMQPAISGADLIILTIPVDAMRSVLPQVLDLMRPDQVVMDAGSTKEVLIDAVKEHPLRRRYVASHPMAGRENSGPAAAISGLFAGKCSVICNRPSSDADAVDMVIALYEALGMRMVELEAHEHDLHAAYVSHISHISSFALALTVLAKEKDEKRIFQLASGGFDSTVRLAKSSPD
ncbi:MAG: prephenate dehydrogenase/arogenate dehydrogenase family protein, partial [Saprospiraceae bacterium]|nr:prephenate dehydrogenase/arogenate dehydrogenase family protein [Saprospiraceae bacterium]